MNRKLNHSAKAGISSCVFAFIVVVLSFGAAASEKIHFAPQFIPGSGFRYRVETRNTTIGKTTTPIANPEGSSRSSQSIGLLVHLEVLDISTATKSLGRLRFRATYEVSRASTESDAFNPDAVSLEDQYGRLEGKSIEFALEPNGQLADLNGLEDLFPKRSETDPMLSWIQALSTGTRFPREGISVGQKWNSERPLAGAPLSGLIWRTESTYLRDEPCHAASEPASHLQQPLTKLQDTCAVILTRFEILRRGSSQSADTPEEYRRNGLRTSGKWTGSGESLDSISLSSGILQSSTQTGNQNIDYEITSASTGSHIHHIGQVQSQSEIKLISGPETK